MNREKKRGVNDVIGIIGLGYIGLPLAVEFSKLARVIGYDRDSKRVGDLKDGNEKTREVSKEELMDNQVEHFIGESGLLLQSVPDELKQCNIFIIAVPTNVDHNYSPDFDDLFEATKLVGRYLSVGDIVIFESTVYPGVTEEECVPILEKVSGFKLNIDFYCGYSPERISPGDKVNKLTQIVKVTSGSNSFSARRVDNLYKLIIEKTYLAPNIKVAEASKVLENAQRDVNISFMNEMALLFDKLEIDTHQVLEAAGTKWNFLKFKPGLVGGHCIGVDPYLLAHKARSVGFDPKVVLSGRRVNNSMGTFVSEKVINLMTKKQINILDSKVLICGITFKENCPDTRNSRVFDIINDLESRGCRVDVYDPWVSDKESSIAIQKLNVIESIVPNSYEAIIIAVAHDCFYEINWGQYQKTTSVLFDVKGILPKENIDGRL